MNTMIEPASAVLAPRAIPDSARSPAGSKDAAGVCRGKSCGRGTLSDSASSEVTVVGCATPPLAESRLCRRAAGHCAAKCQGQDQGQAMYMRDQRVLVLGLGADLAGGGDFVVGHRDGVLGIHRHAGQPALWQDCALLLLPAPPDERGPGVCGCGAGLPGADEGVGALGALGVHRLDPAADCGADTAPGHDGQRRTALAVAGHHELPALRAGQAGRHHLRVGLHDALRSVDKAQKAKTMQKLDAAQRVADACESGAMKHAINRLALCRHRRLWHRAGNCEVLHNWLWRLGSTERQRHQCTAARCGPSPPLVGPTMPRISPSAQARVTSTAVQADNPEVLAARRQQHPRGAARGNAGELMRLRKGIAISGQPARPRTPALVTSVLAEAGLDPTFVMAASSTARAANAQLGTGDTSWSEAE
ncbi:hypothetical protein FQA39_LY19176 [Lamprigera yunnana]|nr:hypothetical protein FQA39_LY19176 [Lamprigera yunnana]